MSLKPFSLDTEDDVEMPSSPVPLVTSVLCRGVIGGSGYNRACARFNCTTKAHQQSKVSLTANALYVEPKKSLPQVLVAPFLPTQYLGVEAKVEELLEETRPLEVWTTWFAVQEASHLGMDTVHNPGRRSIQQVADLISKDLARLSMSVFGRQIDSPKSMAGREIDSTMLTSIFTQNPGR
ncbi:hypothetical protein IV203_030917 [Nitzschia inconspicua]|uniref:Uncharacterized protein n=1 Tax=Nitzschia inconspicua TaxID=303405 RepID=A0A9K3Q4M9_9STRA|nr:hypothetical protein IV203_030917 [Nitzschia inconspicua]